MTPDHCLQPASRTRYNPRPNNNIRSIYPNSYDRYKYGTVIPSHTLFYCLTNFLPDRCSTGPAILGVVSHESGDYRTMTLPPDRPVRSHRALPECQYCPNWLPPTPRSHPTTSDTCLPDTLEQLSLHIHSQSRVYRYVQAFTVLLLHTSGLSP